MPDMKNYINKIEKISKDSRETIDPARKLELAQEFWTTALEAFNEHIAGDIVTVDGRIISTPSFEL